jgi:hypothetical protein
MKSRIVMVCLSFALVFSIAYAATTIWSTSVSVIVTSPLDTVKVYSDAACTQEVTSIDFGNLQQASSSTREIWIKNEGTGTVTIFWVSTLSTVSGGKISDFMKYGTPPNEYYWTTTGTTIAPGIVAPRTYGINIAVDCPTQSFSWTISLEVR